MLIPSRQRRIDGPFPEEPASSAESTGLATDDFYFDGTFLVFTAQYHLRRGFCCNSGCRHCPYQSGA